MKKNNSLLEKIGVGVIGFLYVLKLMLPSLLSIVFWGWLFYLICF